VLSSVCRALAGCSISMQELVKSLVSSQVLTGGHSSQVCFCGTVSERVVSMAPCHMSGGYGHEVGGHTLLCCAICLPLESIGEGLSQVPGQGKSVNLVCFFSCTQHESSVLATRKLNSEPVICPSSSYPTLGSDLAF
jgi:hypothetical protein